MGPWRRIEEGDADHGIGLLTGRQSVHSVAWSRSGLAGHAAESVERVDDLEIDDVKTWNIFRVKNVDIRFETRRQNHGIPERDAVREVQHLGPLKDGLGRENQVGAHR
jgi:hypothetical protein